MEDAPHPLRDLLRDMRQWLGFRAARTEVVLPDAVTAIVARGADLLGRLGWRVPVRSTSIKVLSDGVTGTPRDLSAFGVPPMRPLSATLKDMPARAEDRLFARMALVGPVVVATLALFWFLSGVIALLRLDAAAQVLVAVGWPHMLAQASAALWAVVDIAIASALIWRPTAKAACWAAIATSLFYLIAATVFVPALWLDPLGPLVKVLPALVLALVARIALETR